MTKEFIVTNTRDKDVTISTAFTSLYVHDRLNYIPRSAVLEPTIGMAGHGGSVPPANEIIKVGENRVIRVVFNPNACCPAVGPIDRFIT